MVERTRPLGLLYRLGSALERRTHQRWSGAFSDPPSRTHIAHTAFFDRQFRASRVAAKPVLPGFTAGWNGRSTFDYWPGNLWTKGSYSFWKVGQYTKFAGAEGERSGNCHFAGEHTSIDSQGYLNGAVESGERASKEILADIEALA